MRGQTFFAAITASLQRLRAAWKVRVALMRCSWMLKAWASIKSSWNMDEWRTCFHAKRTGCSNATFLRRPWPARAFAWALAGAKNSTGCTWILSYQMIPAIASESRDSRDSPFFGGFTRPRTVESLLESLPVWNGFHHSGGTNLNNCLGHQIIESLGCCRGVSLAMALPGFQYRPICPPIPRKHDSQSMALWNGIVCVYIICISLYYVHYIAKWDL